MVSRVLSNRVVELIMSGIFTSSGDAEIFLEKGQRDPDLLQLFTKNPVQIVQKSPLPHNRLRGGSSGIRPTVCSHVQSYRVWRDDVCERSSIKSLPHEEEESERG